MVRLPYGTADARLLDGIDKWIGWTGKGQPIPGPWWALACALVAAAVPCLADATARRLVAPWGRREGPAPADAGPGEFRPLGAKGVGGEGPTPFVAQPDPRPRL